jgi:HEAT repeat protein
MDSGNREIQLAAINLVDKASGIEMLRKLADMLSYGGYSPAEYELKNACVKALAEIGSPEALPELLKVMKAYSLLASKNLKRLKVDIVRSLERYPAEAALPILERFASGNDQVAIQAAESLKNLRGRVS